MQHSGHLGLSCILGPEHGQRPSAAQRVPSIAIVKLHYFMQKPFTNEHRCSSGLRPDACGAGFFLSLLPTLVKNRHFSAHGPTAASATSAAALAPTGVPSPSQIAAVSPA